MAAQAAPAVEAVEAGLAIEADAAAAAGVGERTVRRYRAEARQANGTGAPAGWHGGDATGVASEPARPATGPPDATAGQVAGGADRRSALLALLAEALEADAALLAALPLDAGELGRRLADSGLVTEGDLDELAILGRVQARLEADLRGLKAEAVVARKGVVATLVQLAGTAARIRAGRPAETEAPDVVAARMIRDVEAKAIDRIGILTSEAAAKLAADREALVAWGRAELRPADAVVLEQKVDAMLGRSAA